ncbi:hypothetical protein EfmJHP38_20470 [Enterococcus faecium]|nr:hypothetical protein EfmJHP38_20470 [Enterococcus faecium]
MIVLRINPLSSHESEYIQRKVVQGWTPDVIVGRAAFPISCSARTIYRMFKKGLFDSSDLPMKGKRKPNGIHPDRLSLHHGSFLS